MTRQGVHGYNDLACTQDFDGVEHSKVQRSNSPVHLSSFRGIAKDDAVCWNILRTHGQHVPVVSLVCSRADAIAGPGESKNGVYLPG
jgi:hypothetical protein